MYHALTVRVTQNEDEWIHRGHAYNLSLGGAQIELDDRIDPGAKIAVRIHLPRRFDQPLGLTDDGGGDVHAIGKVVWAAEPDPDEPGASRMAVAFTRFVRPVDWPRLRRYLNQDSLRRAA